MKSSMRKSKKIKDARRFMCLKKTAALLATTPALLVYLFVLDIFFLVISSIMTPLMILITIFTCGHFSLESVDDKIDEVYKYLFGMQKMDIIGFRRLRTSS